VAGKLQEANPDFQLRGEEDPSILGLGSGKWPYWPNGKPAIFDISPLQTRDGGVATAMNPPDGILGYFAEIAFWWNMHGVSIAEPLIPIRDFVKSIQDELGEADSDGDE
jgi:hypothetical protein